MTTIVCNRESMAADRRGTGGAIMRVTKIYRVNGSLIGVAGNLEQAMKFIEWKRTGEQRPSFVAESNFSALELRPDGAIIWWGAEMVGVESDDDYYAIGSGAPYALGALSMGAGLKDAVKIASRWDECTGSGVQILSLEQK